MHACVAINTRTKSFKQSLSRGNLAGSDGTMSGILRDPPLFEYELSTVIKIDFKGIIKGPGKRYSGQCFCRRTVASTNGRHENKPKYTYC